MYYSNKTLISTLLAGTLVLGVQGLAIADNGEEMEAVDQAALDLYENEVASSAGGMTADDISDEDLENFYLAAQAVSGVRESRIEMIREMPEDQAESLIESAAAAMQENIEVNDLTVEEYRHIAYLAHNDDEVRARLNAIVSAM